MLRIKRVKSEETFDDIRNIQELIFLKEDWCDPSKIGTIWWIAYLDDVPVGFMGIERWPEVFYVCLCGVLAAYRGQRLQAKLLKVVTKFVSKTNAPEMVSDTTPNNAASMNSFIREGFKTYVPETPWRVAGAVYWRKSLVKV